MGGVIYKELRQTTELHRRQGCKVRTVVPTILVKYGRDDPLDRPIVELVALKP